MPGSDSDPFNTLPDTNTAAFGTVLQTFLREEMAERHADMFGSFVRTGGTHGTRAGLVSSPVGTVAYISGYRINQVDAFITYANDATTWVIAHIDQSGNLANFIRVGSTHYLTQAASSQPALPADSIWLMRVTTSGGAITAVADLRSMSITGILPNTTSYTTIASLRAVNSAFISTENVAHVLYHTTIGDRGGGVFWYDTTATDADDNGMLIVPTNSPATGRWRRVRPTNVVSVDWFGAFSAADATTAIRNAILAATVTGGTSRGGKVVFGEGTYTITGSAGVGILMDRTLVLEGAGAGSIGFSPGTLLNFPAGVTGIDNKDGDWSVIRNLGLSATAKATSTTTGSMTAGSRILTLAAAQDFIDGQTIRIRGAGTGPYDQEGIFGVTTVGSSDVTLKTFNYSTQTYVDAVQNGIYVGMRITIAGAGLPVQAFVTSKSVSGIVIGLSAAATIAVTGQVSYYSDLHARISSGGGTTSLTLDVPADAAVTAATVAHADAGFLARDVFWMENVSIEGFAGPGVFVDGKGARATPSAFVNNFHITNGRIVNNQNGILIVGNDGNNGTIYGVDVGTNVEYGISDEASLGSTVIGAHFSGEFSYRTLTLVGRAVYLGCYTEGGGRNSFAARTTIVGGQIGDLSIGGIHLNPTGAGSMRATVFGDAQTSSYQVSLLSNVLAFQYLNAGRRFEWRKAVSEGLTWWGFFGGNLQAECPFLWSDNDTPTYGGGYAWLPRGYFIGTANNDTLALSSARRHSIDTHVGGPPTTGTWTRGDLVWNSNPSAGGTVGWVCTVSGTPGAWNTFGAIT